MWIQRINAAVREQNLVYSQFIKGIKLVGIELNRKMLSELAIHNAEAFTAILDKVKKALEEDTKKIAK